MIVWDCFGDTLNDVKALFVLTEATDDIIIISIDSFYKNYDLKLMDYKNLLKVLTL